MDGTGACLSLLKVDEVRNGSMLDGTNWLVHLVVELVYIFSILTLVLSCNTELERHQIVFLDISLDLRYDVAIVLDLLVGLERYLKDPKQKEYVLVW